MSRDLTERQQARLISSLWVAVRPVLNDVQCSAALDALMVVTLMVVDGIGLTREQHAETLLAISERLEHVAANLDEDRWGSTSNRH